MTILPLSLIAFSARMKTWEREKRPMRAQVTLMPLYSSSMPNMNRSVPSMGSMPMVERMRPKAPLMSPFTMEPVVTPAMMVSPKRASQKYSGLPNFIASSASMGAKK